MKPTSFIYKYTYHEDEEDLCLLEMRSFFGFDTKEKFLESTLAIDPSRSPFIKERLDVLFEANSIEDLIVKTSGFQLSNSYKVFLSKSTSLSFENRRKIEQQIGLQIDGVVDLHHPESTLGVIKIGERWLFGIYHEAIPIWLKNQDKPHQYSTALSTRVARAVTNIAVPDPHGIKAIDPCCGIGTVLIEALSMGIDIEGSDINPLVVPKTRENLAYFGFKKEVYLRDIYEVTGDFNVAIIDMPYNLCSVLPEETQLEMLKHARLFTKKVVIVTVESIDYLVEQAGFTIIDRCLAKKSSFTREVLVAN